MKQSGRLLLAIFQSGSEIRGRLQASQRLVVGATTRTGPEAPGPIQLERPGVSRFCFCKFPIMMAILG
jgi:hypothetical protein